MSLLDSTQRVLQSFSRGISSADAKARLLTRRSVFWCAAILAQAAVVAILAGHHDPGFSFDESNTLRIAELAPDAIERVLAQDQNFPSYYRILHMILGWTGGSRTACIYLNYAAWLASVLVFRSVAARFFEQGRWQLLATLLYAATPATYYYAFYVRMYALANLAFIASILFLLRYAESKRLRELAAHGACLASIALLHPTGVVLAPLMLCAALLLIGWRPPLVLASLSTVVCVVLIAIQAFAKADPARLYLGTGVEYVKVTSTDFFDVPSQILFRFHDEHSWITYVLVMVLIGSFFAKTPAFRGKHAVLALFCTLFLLAHAAVKSFANSHHYYAFVAPLILALAIGLQSWEGSGVQFRVLALATAAVFALSYASFFYQSVKYVRNCDALCSRVKDLDEGLIVTDYTMFNAVERCMPPGRFTVALYSDKKLFDTSGMSLEELVIAQARMGGTPTSSMAIDAYRRGLPSQGEAREELQRSIVSLLGPRKNLYYLTAYNRSFLFPEELLCFSDFRFQGLLKPSIFWFRREDGAEAPKR